jgi:hypothetical protein
MHSPAASSSRLTLLVGGAGIALATLVPLVARAVFIFPVPYDLSWLNRSWQPLPAQLSAGVLVVACVVLAVGIRRESGIAGTSIIGKLALILFAVANLAMTIVSAGPLPTLGTSPSVLALITAESWTCTLVELFALIIASIVVFRAGVIRGVARWGLVVLAIILSLALVLSHIPNRGVGEIAVWCYPLALVTQFSIGLVYAVHGQRAAPRSRRPVGTARA